MKKISLYRFRHIFAGVFAAVAIVIVVGIFRPPATGDYVVVAAGEIPAGQTIAADSLHLQRVPSNLKPRGAFTKVKSAEGAISAIDIPVGAILAPGMILNEEWQQLDSNEIVVSIELDAATGGYVAKTGQAVELWNVSAEGSDLLSSHARVLGVREPAGGGLLSAENSQRIAFIGVPRTESEEVLTASAAGTLQLVVASNHSRQ